MDEVYESFVENAPFRPRRELIFRALALYIDLVSAKFSTSRYWIDGGFVTHKTWAEPEDADVVVVVPPSEHGRVLTPEFLPYWTLIGTQPSQPSVYSDKVHPMGGLIDGFIEPDVPQILGVWDYRWSTVRDEQHNEVPGARKGYLEVRA
ncbi:hypothetical protein [Mycobacterium sp. 1274756.6]|uniref:DUF6932 family protein n=1 Tax=Mycobacterium sp. 1274756.6 TaxID=1834076 RepID=UPI000800F002|nr:hypothetical protein [Mycobacterium sp. 1274756.6]OBJ73334.1 hypothetical protein A5643_04035 [Mycobacterium sp. 1274756.6]